MPVPAPSYLAFHSDPVRRAFVRQAVEQGARLTCAGEGDMLPPAPPARYGAVGVVVLPRPEPMGRGALRVLRRWCEGPHAPRLLVLLELQDAHFVRALIEAGVSGFVPPDCGAEEMGAAVHTVSCGGVFVSGVLVAGAFSGARRPENTETDAYGLTPREREILVMIALGLSNKDIARRLTLSVRTVETHRLNIRKKTRAGSRRDLVEIAEKLGLLLEFGTQHGLAERRAMPGFHED